jgi:hypothetical protein
VDTCFNFDVLDPDVSLYDKADELLLREHIFKHHSIGQISLGELWGFDDRSRPSYRPYWYNPAVAAREWREYGAERKRLDDIEKAKRKAERERELERDCAEWAEKEAKRQTRVLREHEERISREAEAKRLADIDHEWKRKWAVHTSNMERTITTIVDTIDAGARDRELMRAMLRYMNLGEGLGTQWDAVEFTNHYAGARKNALVDMLRIDVERCYLMLLQRNVGAFECRSPSLAT